MAMSKPQNREHEARRAAQPEGMCHGCGQRVQLCPEGCDGGWGFDCESFCERGCAEAYWREQARRRYQAELKARGVA